MHFEEISLEKYNLLSQKAPLTQSGFFGQWQEAAGRRIRRFEIKNGETVSFFQAIKHSLPFSQSFLYIPHGPVIKENADSNFLKEFHKRLDEVGRRENSAFVRFDFFLPKSDFKDPRSRTSNGFLEKYFKKVPLYAYRSSYFQPKYEWFLNIDRPEEEMLLNMHPKTRYNIRLAQNKKVKTEIVNAISAQFEIFYALLEETAKRNKFNLHPKEYYRNIFRSCDKNNNAFLVIVSYQNEILAANLVAISGDAAYFIYGGSSGRSKNLMAPYLAHWEGILEAKKRGIKVYNFGAVGTGQYEGISRFKKGFGGSLLEYSDSYDLILKPFWHFLYNLKKKIVS